LLVDAKLLTLANHIIIISKTMLGKVNLVLRLLGGM